MATQLLQRETTLRFKAECVRFTPLNFGSPNQSESWFWEPVSLKPLALCDLFSQVDAILVAAAGAAGAEHREYLESIGVSALDSVPPDSWWTVTGLRMQSPLEVMLTIVGAVGTLASGTIALVRLIEYVYNAPVRMSSERERLVADAVESRVQQARGREILDGFEKASPPTPPPPFAEFKGPSTDERGESQSWENQLNDQALRSQHHFLQQQARQPVFRLTDVKLLDDDSVHDDDSVLDEDSGS